VSPVCPNCGSRFIRPASGTCFSERLKIWLGLWVADCEGCHNRFSNDFATLIYASCPRCYRDDLTDWAEEYYLPAWYRRMLVWVGARRQRCEECRVNFISFRPRRRQWVPPPETRRPVKASRGEPVAKFEPSATNPD
jgi:hypothetical protein